MARGQSAASGVKLLFGSRNGKKNIPFRDELTRDEWIILAQKSTNTLLEDNMFDPEMPEAERSEYESEGVLGVGLTLRTKINDQGFGVLYGGEDTGKSHASLYSEQDVREFFEGVKVVAHWFLADQEQSARYHQFLIVAKQNLEKYGIEKGDVISGSWCPDYPDGFIMDHKEQNLAEHLEFMQEQIDECLEQDMAPVNFKLSPALSNTAKDTFYAQIDALRR